MFLLILKMSFLETMSSASISRGSTMAMRVIPAFATSPGSTLRAATMPSMLAFSSVRCRVDWELFSCASADFSVA